MSHFIVLIRILIKKYFPKKQMKTTINISNISKKYVEKVVFEKVSISLHAGDRVGIVGVNGSGKSTFLSMIAAEQKPDEGGIGVTGFPAFMKQKLVLPAGTTVYDYLSQFIESREEYKLYEYLDEFGLEIDLYQPIESLSGGEQKKVSLIALKIQKPDILLLDEPTNHLDHHSAQKLKQTIKDHKWISIFVSHDRHFLNELATKILEIDGWKMTVFHGNYETYKTEKQAMYERQFQEYMLYQKEKKKRDQWLADLRQRASVYVNPARGRLLKSKEKFVEREIVSKKVDRPVVEESLTLRASGGTHQAKILFELKNREIWFWENKLIENISCEMRGKDRIQLIWGNGSGKSSFLKKIMEHFQFSNVEKNFKSGNSIKVDYFDQHNEMLNSSEQVYKRFEKNLKVPAPDTSIRSQLAMIWLTQVEIMWKMSDLSYGQRVKIKFLQMLSWKIDLLILDEPTNHLDISTREAIEEMLQDYEGWLLLVSHDQYFIDQLEMTKKWQITEKRLREI